MRLSVLRLWRLDALTIQEPNKLVVAVSLARIQLLQIVFIIRQPLRVVQQVRFALLAPEDIRACKALRLEHLCFFDLDIAVLSPTELLMVSLEGEAARLALRALLQRRRVPICLQLFLREVALACYTLNWFKGGAYGCTRITPARLLVIIRVFNY